MTTQPQDPAAADLTDAATTPSPDPQSPAAMLRTRRPGWDRSSVPSSPSPDAATDGGGDESGALPPSSDEPRAPRSTKTGGSRGSSRASARELRKAIAVGFTGATEVAHTFLVRDEYGQHVGLILTDETEADQVAEPAANIVARRMKDLPVGEDVADGVALAIAVGAYLLRQLSLWRYARQLRAEQAVVGDGLQHDLTHDQPGAPDPAPAPAPA